MTAVFERTVWFNTHFNLIEPFRQADRLQEFRIVTSYPSRKYPDVLLADRFELEPKLEDAQYVDYCLDFARRHKVDLFVPGRKLIEIGARIDEFTRAGVKVILAGDSATLALLDDKAALYDALPPNLVPIPAYRKAVDAGGFRRSVEELSGTHAVVCFKPTVGIFGYGFKVIADGDHNGGALAGVDAGLLTDVNTALSTLERAKSFKPQLVMEFLPGIERSVDCLALGGRLIRGVVRSKLADGSRYLEENQPLVELSSRIIEKLGLNGLFNIQFKDKEGVPFLLEINPRMSGGISMSCLSGLCFPYWAVKLALDPSLVSAVPQPTTGLRVTEVSRAIRLEA